MEEWQPGEWIHVVDAADGERTYIYRDRAKRDSEVYAGNVSPQAGGAPLRIGTHDLDSFFAGEIHGVRIWSRLLTDTEIAAPYKADLVRLKAWLPSICSAGRLLTILQATITDLSSPQSGFRPTQRSKISLKRVCGRYFSRDKDL